MKRGCLVSPSLAYVYFNTFLRKKQSDRLVLCYVILIREASILWISVLILTNFYYTDYCRYMLHREKSDVCTEELRVLSFYANHSKSRYYISVNKAQSFEALDVRRAIVEIRHVHQIT